MGWPLKPSTLWIILLRVRKKIQGQFSPGAMWPVVSSYIWIHNELWVLPSRRFAPGVFLGSVADSLSLISAVPSKCLPLSSRDYCVLIRTRTHTPLSLTNLSENSFTSPSWPEGLRHYEQMPELSSLVSWWGRFRAVKEVTVTLPCPGGLRTGVRLLLSVTEEDIVIRCASQLKLLLEQLLHWRWDSIFLAGISSLSLISSPHRLRRPADVHDVLRTEA